ncbi:SRPBCC family protein [Aquihabitans sp. McL0605]|uniref:SRPBCC family protein n=1 Tax=Aquihabitans sp. McL0605 TaxID=3415671 RepID=UPI003CEA6552
MPAATVTRSLHLAAAPHDVWASLADERGLSGWLADDVRVVVAPGQAGTATDGGTTRRMVVTEVEAGRSVGFVWWDEAQPADASVVTISVEADAQGDGSIVTVTERLAGAGVAHLGAATVADLGSVEAHWDRRLRALVGAGEPALAAACV